jgi:hypothetical protein
VPGGRFARMSGPPGRVLPISRAPWDWIPGARYRCCDWAPRRAQAPLPVGLGVVRKRETLESDGYADDVRAVPWPGFSPVRHAGGATVAGGDCAAPTATYSEPARGRHVTFGMHNVVPGARSSVG